MGLNIIKTLFRSYFKQYLAARLSNQLDVKTK